MGVVVGRGREIRLLQTVSEQARSKPAVLMLDGEAGIGKTTLCRAAATAAADEGDFAVLTASGAAAEVSLAWAGLADLLSGFDDDVFPGLLPLHRQALESVSAGIDVPGGDERLVAAAFRAALIQQSRVRPVVMIVDDAQWLDEPSRMVVGFAVRRLTGRVAVIVALRTGEAGSEDLSWIRPPDPQSLSRLTVGPMNREDLAALIGARLGRTPSAASMTRIHAVSGGNPFYAMELARFGEDGPATDVGALPPTLAALVRNRIGGLDSATNEALVTVAAAFEPTVDLVAGALGCTSAELIECLQPLESRGVLVFDGPRIRFAHPLLLSGVAGGADPAIYRRAHRRLADAVGRSEQRARHLALSTPHGDVDTLAALDAAAEAAAARGTYSVAAELAALAIRRGGDTEFRRLRGAELHFRAGALDEAEDLLAPVVDGLPAGFMRTVGLMLLAAIQGYRNGFARTVTLLERAVEEADDNLMLRTQARLLLSTATGVAGDLETSVRHARQARADAQATGIDQLRSQALSVWVSASIIHGLGFDSEAMREALDIGDPDNTAPVMFRPTTVHAQTCAWTGRLDEARAAMTDVKRLCAERGNELDVIWAAEQLVMIDLCLGRYADAECVATEALERALQNGGCLPLINAYTAVAGVAAHRGRLDEAREAAGIAVEKAIAGDMNYLARPPLMSLAFAQVSEGRYDDALHTLKPLLSTFDPVHGTEIMVGAYVPDAVEALTALDRTAEAGELTAALEANGARHDRPWMRAVGARCRALVLAAEGDLDGALLAAERAMSHHDLLPMPFERARTQLLLGQLQRRRRRTQAARENLTAAASVFDEIGSPQWSARAHRELERVATGTAGAVLSDSERTVAEHAAAGLANKEIAAAMFLSVKTVEMHLSNVYRKLGIRSRAQLSDRLRCL